VSTQDKVKINKLPTGVPGLNEIVGGGLPEFSFNIIAGAPGSGKTTLAHQFVFANATPERPALYSTVLGESAIKMLRYQQQYTFFDPAKLPDSIRFINLSQVVLETGTAECGFAVKRSGRGQASGKLATSRIPGTNSQGHSIFLPSTDHFWQEER